MRRPTLVDGRIVLQQFRLGSGGKEPESVRPDHAPVPGAAREDRRVGQRVLLEQVRGFDPGESNHFYRSEGQRFARNTADIR
jgi:hypothetical protein